MTRHDATASAGPTRPRGIARSAIIPGLAIAVVHFFATVVALAAVFGTLLGPGGPVVNALAMAFLVLGFPVNVIMTGVLGLPDGAVFGGLAANSLLWGAAAASLLALRSRRGRAAVR